jgi:3-hydroxyisobutyrate dehydrogenase
MPKPLAFIGTGIMGSPMASHLLAAGHPLSINTRTKSKATDLLAKGATWSDSPKAAASAADTVFICVTDTPDVESVVLGPNGIIHSARPGLTVIDHSTISPSATKRFAQALAEKGAHLLDAPVSGGDVGARNATLSIMVGGDQAAFEQIKPLLNHMGKTIVHCGPSGYGQLTKLVNQVLVAGTLLSVCEAMAFAQQNGLDLQKTLSVVTGGAANSWQLANLGPRIANHDFAPGFMIDLMQKDLRIVLSAAFESGVALPATGLAHTLFTSAQSAGHGTSGTQALFSVLQRLSKGS